MTGEERIRKALLKIYSPGEVNACQVYKAWGYSRGYERHGWWCRPFARNTWYLGRNISDALEAIDDIASMQE